MFACMSSNNALQMLFQGQVIVDKHHGWPRLATESDMMILMVT